MSPQICYSRFTVFWGPGQKTLNPARQRQRNFCPHLREKNIFSLKAYFCSLEAYLLAVSLLAASSAGSVHAGRPALQHVVGADGGLGGSTTHVLCVWRQVWRCTNLFL